MRLITVLLAAFILVPATAHADRGVPRDGFPSWQERMLLVLANRARAEPGAERFNRCGVLAVSPPLVWDYRLNRAARFHSANMARTHSFSHDSPCTLVTDISDLFEPYGDCDGSASCACVGGSVTCEPSCTSFGARLGLFGLSGMGLGENIARGQTSPREVHDGWMNSAGHCSNLLGDWAGFGGGWVGNSWTQNFSTSGSPDGTLIAGGHEPRIVGSAAGNVEFRVNYYDGRGGPLDGVVNIDGECAPMTLERGVDEHGTYLGTVSLAGSTCRRYVFEFEDPSGAVVYLPEVGSYGVGGSACPDWDPEVPLPCGQLEVDPPVVEMPASADEDPVTTTTTTLSVMGAHQSGESSLIYGWSADGPEPVIFSENDSNAASTTVATFSSPGEYLFEVIIMDRQGQTAESSVDVEVVSTIQSVEVSPARANVEVGASRHFSATGTDQFGASTSDAIFAWSVGGGGEIDEDGLFTAGEVPGGPHTVRASAEGREGTATVTVVDEGADTDAPDLVLVHPVDGQVVAGVVRFIAEASDESGVARVDFLVNGQQMGTVNTEPYERSWNTAGRAGEEVEIWARATDIWGNEAVTTPISVRIVDARTDERPPTVAITSPKDGDIIDEPTLWISAEAEDDVGVAFVDFEIDEEIVGTLFAPPWEIGVDATLFGPGEVVIVAIAEDVAGNVTPSEPVRVDLGSLEGGCGCAAGRGTPAAAAMFLVLVLLALRPRGEERRLPRLRG